MQPVVINVGRIAPEKNLPLGGSRAFRKLQVSSGPDARFVWVGDGPARAETAGTTNPGLHLQRRAAR